MEIHNGQSYQNITQEIYVNQDIVINIQNKR